MRWRGVGARGVGAVVCGGLLVAGCASVGADDAGRAAADFQQRVTTADWAAACDLLSEHARQGLESAAARSCAAALPALHLPTDAIGGVEVWGRNAGVEVGTEAVFLSRFGSGWRVIAAGCTARGKDLPYDCTVGG